VLGILLLGQPHSKLPEKSFQFVFLARKREISSASAEKDQKKTK